jgi:Uma2 family endonuclease
MATVKGDQPPTTAGPGTGERNGAARPAKLPPLEQGDHLDQQTFHARYEAMPPGTRAELIGGVVHMPSPIKPRHGRRHLKLDQWLGIYEDATPGVVAFDNVSVIIDNANEPQPDACLAMLPPGQLDEDEWLRLIPELMAEVASSSESYDLHAKKQEYEKAGVKEYLVIALRHPQVHWFILRQGRYATLAPGPDGIYRSETFPGLWLDPDALLQHDGPRLMEVLQQGVNSPEHAAFVQRLSTLRPSV